MLNTVPTIALQGERYFVSARFGTTDRLRGGDDYVGHHLRRHWKLKIPDGRFDRVVNLSGVAA
jgi:hypothetical protein